MRYFKPHSMKISIFCFFLFVFYSSFKCHSDEPAYLRRPYEIDSGVLKAPETTIWSAENNGMEGWTIVGKGALGTDDAFRMWNDTSAKIVFEEPGIVTVRPVGLEIAHPVSGIALWLIGPKSGKTTNTIQITDANKNVFKIITRNNSSFWNRTPWWGTSSFLIPEKAVFPVRISEINFEAGSKTKAGDTLHFDFIHTFDIRPVDYPKELVEFPSYLTTPDSIMPTPPAEPFTNSIAQDGKNYIFSYKGKDGSLLFIYAPGNGTLGDISVVADGRPAFMPMLNGGPIVHKGGTTFKPVEVKEASLDDITLSNGVLTAKWTWSTAGKKCSFTYTFAIKARSLVVTADCDEPCVSSFDCGYVDNLPNPRLFGLTYLHYRWDYPRLLVNDDCFVSLFPDWYYGNACAVVDGSAYGELPGAAVLGKASARILGGLVYNPPNRASRNLLHERFFLTVAPKLEDVLPNNPNPKSKYFDKMRRLVCHTRMYPVVEPKDAPAELAYERRLKDYGVTDIFIRTHYNEFRTPIHSNNFTFSYDTNLQAGGDDVMIPFYNEMRRIFPVVGPYQDNRVIHPLSSYFNYDFLSQWYDDTIISGWDGSYQLNPLAQRISFARFTQRFIEKFGWNGCYLDETTNTPPWGLIDANRFTPGAGTYRCVLLNYGKLLQEMQDRYKGPIWSEGNADFFWTGCLDTDYAQCNVPDALPMPDYKIRKMNPLENLNGYDLTKAQNSVDYLLSAEIVNGNIGHLWGGKTNTILGSCTSGYPIETYTSLCKSYFMVRQLQEYYTGVPVKEIRYQCGNELLTSSEMLRRNLPNEGKVYEIYENGLEIWVNRNPEGSWNVTVDGKEMLLPPYGYAACLPGKLLEYSAIVNGNRVDYSRGPLYTYVDGRGNTTAFPEITAANAYVFHKAATGRTLTPVPFQKEESITGLSAKAITQFAQDGTALGTKSELELLPDGKARFTTTQNAFRYQLE